MSWFNLLAIGVIGYLLLDKYFRKLGARQKRYNPKVIDSPHNTWNERLKKEKEKGEGLPGVDSVVGSFAKRAKLKGGLRRDGD